MLSKSDEEVLNDRLRNWGRWSAVTPAVASNILYKQMVAAGTIKLEPSNSVVPIDHTDALLVNRAWQSMAEEPLQYFVAKRVLVLHFCRPDLPPDVACRKIKLKYKGQCVNRLTLKEYNSLLTFGKRIIFNRIMCQTQSHLVRHAQPPYNA